MKRSAAAATMRVSKRRFGVQEVRPAVGRTALGGSASGAVADAADAVFADAKAFLDSPEAGQMSQGDLERELDRRRRELVGSLVQACRDERNLEQAAGPAALTRHRAAAKSLTDIGSVIARMQGAKRAIRDWEIASDEADLRRNGGILCGGADPPIMPHQWPTFDQVADAIKERDASAAARDAALEQLKNLGLDPNAWK